MQLDARTGITSVALLALACAAPNGGGASDTASRSAGNAAPPATSAPVADTSARARLAQLEADARALAKTTGCSTAAQCRTAPVGERGCGGPRAYITYCAATTDSVALFRKLDALKAAEITFNKSSGMMSTCEFRMPPAVAVQGGSCKAATP